MRKILEILLLFFLFNQAEVFSQNNPPEQIRLKVDSILHERGEAYIGIPVSERKSFTAGSSLFTPDKITDTLLYYHVDESQYQQILESGITYNLYTAPSMAGTVRMALNADEILNGTGYPTYQQYLDLMMKFANDYPALCTIDTIGYSIAGKLILAARLQKGSYKPGDKPVVFYSSTIHGDEALGYSMMLMLISEFLKNSESSAQISSILNETVVIINPSSNPDATYFGSDTSLFGAKRRNLTNTDLNRNFHDIRSGINYSYGGLQKENLAMVHYMEKFPPSISANFHTGAEVLNYPWDSWESTDTLTIANTDKFPHADNKWFVEICKDYVDLARVTAPFYLYLYPEGYVIGSVWYTVFGGRQDFVTYCLRGRELTIELSNTYLPDASELPGYWTKNKSALINLIEKADFGIHGTVIDSVTLKPVSAKVEIPGYDRYNSYIYSYPATGKFFRYLPEGSYNVRITADGYRSKTINAEVLKNQQTTFNVLLVPITLEVLVKAVPGSNELQIELRDDNSEIFNASLYDLSGRKVEERNFRGNLGTMNNVNLKGVYILRIRSDNQSVSRLVYCKSF
jgi:hypothetical protein